jgi:hypothetical protein
MKSNHSKSVPLTGNNTLQPERTQGSSVYVLFIDRSRMLEDLTKAAHPQSKREDAAVD